MQKPRIRITYLLIVVALFASSIQYVSPGQSNVARAGDRPNILLIVTDDQRFDTMEFMPRTKARVFDEGVTFTNAFVTTPLCCPSRASIYTGMYAGNHKVHENLDPLTTPTFAQRLDASNYYTGLVGTKYLNSWPDFRQRPEFDYWAVGGDAFDNQMFVNGATVQTNDYITYTYRDYAARFLEQAAEQSDPFMLMLPFFAPHLPAIPAPGDENLHLDLPAHRPPNFGEADMADKPASISALPSLTSGQIDKIDAARIGQIQTLNAVDIAVDDLLTMLDDLGTLDNTMVMFLSDNGYFWGEHRLSAKRYAYEESIRVPFGIRYPARIPAGTINDQFVANIDIAATIYDLTGVATPTQLDGRSLLPLLEGTNEWRDDLLFEGWGAPSYNAVRTARYKYIEGDNDERELYDLLLDPYELDNVYADDAYASVRDDMLARLDRLKPERTFEAPTFDNTSERVKYGGWALVTDDNASSENYSTTTAAWNTARFVSDVATEVAIITYRGPDQGLMRVKIDGIEQPEVDLYAPTPEYRHVVRYGDLSLARHTIVVSPRNQRNPESVNAYIRIDAFDAAGKVIENDNSMVTYSGWAGVNRAGAYLKSYRQSSTMRAALTFFVERQTFTLITARGPAFGIADIYINGSLHQSIDLYSPTLMLQQEIVITGPTTTSKPIRIEVSGRKNPASSGTTIVFDGITMP
jgi:N-acetylglucosamine-6-sulfatase